MRTRQLLRFALLAATVVPFAACVGPSNPFDPDTPVDLQARARLVGHVRGVDAEPVKLMVEDAQGELLRADGDGALLVFETRPADAPLPAGLEEGPGKAFEIPELVPGTYTVVFDAALNGEALLQDARAAPATLAAGGVAVRDVAPVKKNQDELAGGVLGRVEGAIGGASFVVRLVAKSGDPALEQLQFLSNDGTFSFQHVPPGDYRVQASGDTYAPASTAFFTVADDVVELGEPLRLTTLGRVFVLDDFRGDEGLPPFAPFVRASPVHVAVAPLALTDAGLVPFARVYTDETRPGPEEGWVALTGAADLLEAPFDVEGADGPRTVLAQLRLCFQQCTCANVDADGGCLDAGFEDPLVSREIEIDFVLDTTPPRAVSVQVDDVVRTSFGEDAAALEESPVVVPVSCARFGDAECALATFDSARAAVSGDIVDDTSRLVGFAVTLDDATEPLSYEPVLTLGQLARISADAPPVQKQSGEHTLRIWGQDAAGNVGLVDVRRLVVDVEGLTLASPALLVEGIVTRGADEIVPGASVTVDVAVEGGEVPSRWRVRNEGAATARGAVIDGLIPYTGPQQLVVDGAHLSALSLFVDAVDAVGNVTRTSAPRTLLLSRTSELAGTVSLENRLDVAGASASLVNAAGANLLTVAAGESGSVDVGNPDPLTGELTLDGSYSFTGVPVASSGGVPAEVYTVVATGPAPFGSARTTVEVTPPGPTAAPALTLLLPRGSLLGRFVLEGREAAPSNSGIQVTLFNSLGDEVGAALTFATGTWRVGDLPVGTGYRAVAFFDGFIQVEVVGIEVVADTESVVLDDGAGQPTPVVLNELSGDFRLCDTAPTLELTCTPLQFTRASQVQVGGISFDGIARYRVATTPFSAADASPPFVDVEPVGADAFVAPPVPLGATEGKVTVFLQLESVSGTAGNVLTSDIVVDRTPPANVSLTLERGRGALVDGFTNEAVGRLRVSADAGSGDVAPLRDARVVFAAAPPAAPPPTACVHDASCAVPFDDTAEGTKTAFAFSCDQAGNCSAAPVSASIVVDKTAPSLAHGAAFRPTGTFIVDSGGQLFTRTAVFDIAVQTGRARTGAGAEVRDLQGGLVADVFGLKVGLNSLVDDGVFKTIPAPAPRPDEERVLAGLVSLPAIDDTYTLFAQLTDAAGNTSTVANNPFAVDLTLDTRGPALTFVVDGGAAFTRDPVISLDVNDQSIDRATIVQLNEDGLFDDADPTSFEERALPLLDTAFTLSAGPAPLGDGEYRVFGRFFDRAGNVTERSDSIVLDRTPPEVLLVGCASCATFGGAEFTRDGNRQVILDTLAIDGASNVETVRTTVRLGALVGVPAEVPFGGTTTVTLSVLEGGLPVQPDGTYDIDVVFIDEAGNVTSPTTVTVTIDVVAPVPTLVINGGVGFTSSENVTLTIGGSDATSAVAGIRVQNTAATFAGGLQPLVSSLAHQLANPGVDENKLVFLEATDAAGNVGLASASIFLDKTPPAGTVTIAGGAARTNTLTPTVALAYTITDAVEHALTTADTGFPSNCAGVAFTDAPPPATTQVTLAGTGGDPEVRTVSVCTRDRAGNTALAFDTIILDQDVPTGSVTLNGGAAFTTSRTLTATLSLPPDAAQVKSSLSGPGVVTPLDCAAAAGYGPVPNPATVTLAIPAASAAGLYTAQVCIQDAAGNVSRDVNGVAAPVVDEIVFDAAAPAISVVLNEGAAFTTSATVTLAITASDDLATPLGGISSMRLANTTPTFAGTEEPFTTARTTTVAAATTEGAKTVCVEVKDAAGRTANACDDITLDLTPPAGSVVVARATGNFSTASTGVLSTTFRSADPTIAKVAFGQAPLDCAALASSSFEALAPNTDLVRNVTVAPGEGTRSVTGCFQAQSGLLSAITDTVFVDPTDPPLAQPTAPANNSFSATRRPLFTWGAVDGAATYTLSIRRVSDQVPVLTQAGITTLSFTPTADLPEVPLEWIVVAVKPSGRSSAVDFTGAPRVTPDAAAPSAASGLTIAVHAGKTSITTPAPCIATRPCLNDPFPTLSFTAGADVVDTAVAQIVEVALNGDFTSPVFSTTRADGTAFDVPIVLGDGFYRWRVRTVDDAGNTTTSTASDFIVDRTAPDTPTLVPSPDPVSQAVAPSIPLLWSNEGDTGAVNYRFEITTEARGFTNPLLSVLQPQTNRNVDGVLEDGASVRHLFRVFAVDALGNTSQPAVSTFIHDSVAPCTNTAQLNIIGTDAGNLFTDSSVVTVEILCGGDNPSRMQVGCDGVAGGKPFVSFANVATCVLPSGQGLRTVEAIVSDDAGNSTAFPSDSITVDTSDPTAPVLATGDTVTNLTSFAVTLAEASTDAAFDRHEILDGVTLTSFVPMIGATFSLPLGPANRTHNVRVRGVDRAGNVSAEALVKVTFDDTPPSAPVILGAGTTRFVNADSFTFSLQTGSQDANFSTYETASCTGASCSPGAFAPNPGNGVFTFNLTQNQTTTFAVRARDLAGNVSGSSTITVVEDSRNPRPMALEPLPAVFLGGSPVAVTGFTGGPYVDVFFARSETNVTAANIDTNFDHFEVRGSTAELLGFVPVCETATTACPTPFQTDNGFTVDGRDFIIKANNNIVGFRVPVARNLTNTITVRSVDKAGNVSLETSVSSREVSEERVTSDSEIELAYNVFGDKLAYVRQSTSSLVLHEAGADQLWGTADDGVTVLDSGVFTAGVSSFSVPGRVSAFGPNMVFYAVGSPRRIVMRTGGTDGVFSTAADNPAAVTVSADVGAVVTETVDQREPSFWRDRLVWRQMTSATNTDVMIRQPGADRAFGTGDDTFHLINNAPHQMNPVVSGDNLAWLSCASTDATQCGGAAPFTLTVQNAGADHVFGTGDDVGPTTLVKAVNIDDIRIELYTPGTPGRPACRNVVAYAGTAGAAKGVHVIAAGPDGVFEANEIPVQVMNHEAGGSFGLRSFSLYDTLVIAGDGNVPPATEVAFAGPDGCLTRTADNIVFDSGLDGTVATVHGNVIVGETFDPTRDVVRLELGSERPLWPRDEAVNSSLNADVDRRGVAFGDGAFYDFSSRVLRTLPFSGHEVDLSGAHLAHASSSPFGTQTISVRNFGVDELFGTADDVEVPLTGTRPYQPNNNFVQRFGLGFSLDERTVAWAGKQTASTSVVPVIHTAGADGSFGTVDDCEREVGAPPRTNYKNVAVSGRRLAFQECTEVNCSSTVNALSVREVTGDVCSGTETVTQLVANGSDPVVEGETFFYGLNGVRIVSPGDDHRLTTTADNVERQLFQPVGTSISGRFQVSGDRVAWIDARSQTARVILGDVGDLSTRVLTRSVQQNESVSIHGDVIHYGTETDEVFVSDPTRYYLGLEPDLSEDFVHPGPTALRCPTDDPFEENDSRATATRLNNGAVASAILCNPDVDQWVVNVPASCTLRVRASMLATNGDLDVEVFDPNEVLRGSALTGLDDELVAFTTPVAGDYRIRIFPFNGASNVYDIGVSFTCP